MVAFTISSHHLVLPLARLEFQASKSQIQHTGPYRGQVWVQEPCSGNAGQFLASHPSLQLSLQAPGRTAFPHKGPLAQGSCHLLPKKQVWTGWEDYSPAGKQPRAVRWWGEDLSRCEGSCSQGSRQGWTTDSHPALCSHQGALEHLRGTTGSATGTHTPEKQLQVMKGSARPKLNHWGSDFHQKKVQACKNPG